MSDNNFKPSLQLVLAHEGGFSNHPRDPGGATNKGVTQKVYDAYRKSRGLALRSVRFIEDSELDAIYRLSYWNKVDGDRLPAGIDYAVFDYAVNSGVSKAVKDLQRTVNAMLPKSTPSLKVDGILGDTTLSAVCDQAAEQEIDFIHEYCARRMKFLKSLSTFSDFGKGWTRRVLGDKPNYTADEGDHGVIDYAVKMAKEDLQYPLSKGELPTAVGEKEGEVPAKAVASDQKVTATKGGVGAVVAGVGVSGNTVIAAADQIKPHIDDSIVGKVALGAFALLMLVGVFLLIWDFWRKQQEKSSNA